MPPTPEDRITSHVIPAGVNIVIFLNDHISIDWSGEIK